MSQIFKTPVSIDLLTSVISANCTKHGNYYILNMNSKIELYAFLDTMLWKEGLNLIEAENMDNYNPREEISNFLNVKTNKLTKDNIIKQTCDIPLTTTKPSSLHSLPSPPPSDIEAPKHFTEFQESFFDSVPCAFSPTFLSQFMRPVEEEKSEDSNSDIPGLIDATTGLPV